MSLYYKLCTHYHIIYEWCFIQMIIDRSGWKLKVYISHLQYEKDLGYIKITQ